MSFFVYRKKYSARALLEKRRQRDLVDRVIREALRSSQYAQDLETLSERQTAEPPPEMPKVEPPPAPEPLTVNVSLAAARHKTITMRRNERGDLVADVIESEPTNERPVRKGDLRRALVFK